jgi:SIT family siderophore-iron:H+ symporter-like MFS transporter
MFTFLVPICLAPVILALAWAQRKARKLGYLDSVVAPWKHGSAKVVARDVFWQTDFVGLLLLVAGLSLLLIPMTIARTAARGWQSPLVPGMMVPGGVTLAAFGVWEAKFARFPIFPVYLLHSRTIIFGFMINLCNPMAGSVQVCPAPGTPPTFLTFDLQGNYLYSWYLVGANQSVLSATRLNSLAVCVAMVTRFSGGSFESRFTATLTAAATGLAVMKVRRLKPFIFAGALIQILALGLMTRFRGRENSIGELAILQVLKGIGGGMINFPTQAAAQTACKHEHVAVITAAFLAVFYIGRAVGSAIGGAIWSAQLPSRLLTAVGDPALATTIYRNPIGELSVCRGWSVSSATQAGSARTASTTLSGKRWQSRTATRNASYSSLRSPLLA